MFWKLLALLLEFDSALDLSEVTVLGTNTSWKGYLSGSPSLYPVALHQIHQNLSHFSTPEATGPLTVLDASEITIEETDKKLLKILSVLQEIAASSFHTSSKGSRVICVILNTQLANFENTHGRIFRTDLPKTFQITSRLYFWIQNSDYLVEAYFTKQALTLKTLNESKPLESTVVRRKNFNAQVIIVANDNAWDGISPTGNSTLPMNGGWSLSNVYLAYMQDYLNFTIAFTGHVHWFEMFEAMKCGKADIAASTAMIIAPKFTKDLRYLSTPTLHQKLRIYYSTPDGAKTVKQLFHIKPFHWTTWLAIFLTLVLLFLIHHLMPCAEYCDGDSFLYVLSVLAMQGFNIGDKNSIRILTFAGFVLFSVLNGVYAAGLISSLSMRHEQKSDLQQLVGEGFKFGFPNISYLHGIKLFGVAAKNSRELKTIFSKMHSSMGLTEIPDGIKFVLTHKKYAFVTEENVFLTIFPDGAHAHFDNTTICNNLRYMEIPQYSIQKSPIVPPDSPFANHFNIARQRMRETGVWFRHNRETETLNRNSEPDCPTASAILRRLDPSDVLLPALFLITGLVICIILFFIEILFQNTKSKTNTLSTPQHVGLCLE